MMVHTHTFGWIARMGAEVAGLYSHDEEYLSSECAARRRFQICARRSLVRNVGFLIDKKNMYGVRSIIREYGVTNILCIH